MEAQSQGEIMKKHFAKTLGIIALTLLAVCIFAACQVHEIITEPTISVKSISVSGEMQVNEGEFDLANYTLTVTTSDGKSRTEPLLEENLTNVTVEQLQQVGTYNVTVAYDGVATTFTLTVIDASKGTEGLAYSWEGDHYAVSGYTGTETDVVIPARWQNEAVTEISKWAFSNCAELTNIMIPDSVTKIRESAFSRCTGLVSITIPKKVTLIEIYTFFGCTSLRNITIPNGVTAIGNSAFSGCTSLATITIPDSVTKIGDRVFERSLTALQRLEIMLSRIVLG